MFRRRFLTTIILIPVVLLVIFYANRWFFAGALLLVLLTCGQEWLQLIPLKHRGVKIAFLLGLVVMVGLAHYGFIYWLLAAMVIWGLILIAVILFPASQFFWGYPGIVACAGLFLLPLFGQSIMRLYFQPQGKALLVYLFLLVWAADIGAYLAGKKWGRHKLIPYVSPGKTIEGIIGGFCLSLLVALGAYYYFQPPNFLLWVSLAAVISLVSVLGDLFISMLKRRCKIKDTGSLIPGHGGILDRLDSLIAASPLFYCGMYFLRF